MFYYLGIVLDEDWESGWIFPTYVLCKNPRSKEELSFAIREQDPEDIRQQKNLRKILVTEPYGNENAVEYMSHTRVSNVKDRKSRTLLPKGYLCYFPCDIHGTPDQRSFAIVIHHVPVKRRYKTAIVTQEDNRILSERISTDPRCFCWDTGNAKPHFCQRKEKKEKKHERNGNET